MAFLSISEILAREFKETLTQCAAAGAKQFLPGACANYGSPLNSSTKNLIAFFFLTELTYI